MFYKLYSKINIRVVLLAIFLFSLMARISMINLTGTPVYYPDELLYTRVASSFFHDLNTDFRNNFFISNNVLYSVIISISFLFGKSEIIYLSMKMINCVLMSAVIFPSYYLAEKILNRKNIAIVIALVSVIIPDMFDSLLITQEPLYYLVSMCTFCVLFRDVNSSSSLNSVMLGLMFFLSYFTKAASLVLLLGFIGLVIIDYIIIKSITLKTALTRLSYTIGTFIICFFLIKIVILFINGFPNVESLYNNVTDIPMDWATLEKALYGIMIYIFYIALGFLVFPIMVLTASISRKNNTTNKFTIYFLFTIFTTIVMVVMTIFIKENHDVTDVRFFTRYFFVYFIPVIILTLKILLEKQKVFNLSYLMMTICMALIANDFIGKFRLTSYPLFFDAPMLVYFRLINKSFAFETVYNILIIFGLIFFSYLLYKDKTNLLIKCIFGIVFTVSILNNVVLYKNYYDFNKSNIYGSEDLKNEIIKLNDYFYQKKEKGENVSILLLPQEFYGTKDDFRMVSLESMSNFQYYYLPFNESILNVFQDGRFNLKGYAPNAYIYTNAPRESIDSVQYIISTVQNAEFENVEPIEIEGIGKHFKVFKINNSEFKVKYLVDNLYLDNWNNGEVKLRLFSKEENVKINLNVEALPDTKLIIKQEGGVFEEKSIKPGEPITFTAHNINGNYIDITLSGSISFIPHELDPNSSDMRELSFKLLDITL